MPRRDSLLQTYAKGFQARHAARGRLPIWLALLMPIMVISTVLLLTVSSIFVFWRVHLIFHPEISFSAMSGAAFILIFFASFIGSLGPALMLLNSALVRIPPLKRILDRNSEGVPGASY